MNESATRPSQSVLLWLVTHTGFPGQRLPSKAETLLLIADAAAQDEAVLNASNQRRFPVPGQTAGETASLKAMAERRRRVHYKCDNSAKV